MLSAKHERFIVRGPDDERHEEHQLVFSPLVSFDTRRSKVAELPARWQEQLRLAHLMVPASISRVDPDPTAPPDCDDEPECEQQAPASNLKPSPGAGAQQKEKDREPLLSGTSDDESDGGATPDRKRPPLRPQLYPRLPQLLQQLRFAAAARLLSAPQSAEMLTTLVLSSSSADVGPGAGAAQESAFDLSSVFRQYRHYLVIADASAQTLFALPIRRHFIEVQSSRHHQYNRSMAGEISRALRFGRETVSMYLPSSPAEPSSQSLSQPEPMANSREGLSKPEGASIVVVYTTQSFSSQKLPGENHKAVQGDENNDWQQCVELEEGVLLRLAIESFPVVRLINHSSSALLVGQSTETLALLRGGSSSATRSSSSARVFEQRDRLGQPVSVRARSAVGYTPPLINFYLSVQLERDQQLWQRAAVGPAAALELFRRSAESHTKLLALAAQQLVFARASPSHAYASTAAAVGALRWSAPIPLPDLTVDEEPEVMHSFEIGERAFTLRVDSSSSAFPVTIHVIDPLDPEPPLPPAIAASSADSKNVNVNVNKRTSWKRRVTSKLEFGQLQLLVNDSQLLVPDALYMPTFAFTVNQIRASSDYCPAAEVPATNAAVCGCEFTRLRSELAIGAVEAYNLCHALQHAEAAHRFAAALPGLPPFLYGSLVSTSRLISSATVDATLAHLPQSVARYDRRSSIDPAAEIESAHKKHPARRSRSVLLREVSIEFGDRLELLIEDTFLLHLSNLMKSYNQALSTFVPQQYVSNKASAQAPSTTNEEKPRAPDSAHPEVESATTENQNEKIKSHITKRAKEAKSNEADEPDLPTDEELLMLSDPTAVGQLRSLLNPLVVGKLRIGAMNTQLTLQCKSRVMPMCISLSDAQLQFPAFALRSSVLVPQLLARELISHYMVNALFTSARVLGSLEMLGNPAGIAREWSSGVGALFGFSDRHDPRNSNQRSSQGFVGSICTALSFLYNV